MRVRILSGNLAGQVVVMDRTEAEINLATGFVEVVADVSAPVPVAAEPEVVEEPEKEKPSTRRQR